MQIRFRLWLLFVVVGVSSALAQTNTQRGDRMLAEYWRTETARLQNDCLADVKTLADWQVKRPELLRQLREMLGLDPLPEKTDLQPVVTGKTDHADFVVERLHFQSRPGLYVTGNLYLPKAVATGESKDRLPAILYLCGHGRVAKNGVSYGNKTHYQHHGAWFAQNGYVCLTIDSLQLGEIEATHHGTHRFGMWWWLNRGYTPAGVEAWNCIRALDYLQSRPEVNPDKLGVTGRSGGGAYSWWIAALDERIKAAVPVAGITDLENHVVDGCVEGHCDCMYMVNAYRWDYPMVAALVAPRPLLISNTDRDGIFPLEGVVRTHRKARDIYNLHKAGDNIALHITAGPHKDTPELRVHAFRWFDQHLKGEDRLPRETARKFFEPEQLQVFTKLPADEKNTQIHESFVAAATPPVPPADKQAWEMQRDEWRKLLQEKSFAGWPREPGPLDLREAFHVAKQDVRFRAWDFTSQSGVRLRLFLAHRDGLEKPELTVLNVLDDKSWPEFLAGMRPAFEAELRDETLPEADESAFRETQAMFKSFKWAMAYVAPRGVGPTAFDASEKKQTQNRRRFYLLGQTLDGQQVFDVRRAIQTVRELPGIKDSPLWLQSHRTMAGVTLYASLFEPSITRLDLYYLPTTHRNGPIFLNVSRFLDVPQAVAMAAERSRVVLYQPDSSGWDYATATAKNLGWGEKQLQLRQPPKK